MACFRRDPPEYYSIMEEVSLLSELMFFNHMMMQFFIEYKDDIKLNHDHVRNLKKIAINYIQTDFKMDFIPLIPMQLI